LTATAPRLWTIFPTEDFLNIFFLHDPLVLAANDEAVYILQLTQHNQYRSVMDSELFLTNLEKSFDLNFQDRSLLPGDDVTPYISLTDQEIQLGTLLDIDFLDDEIAVGTGLKQIGSQIICEIAGILKHKEPRRYWVEQDTRKVSASLPPFILAVNLFVVSIFPKPETK
jgi:hypothetical protein